MEPTPETAAQTPQAPSLRGRHPRSSRGTWTIVAIFAVGLAVLAGLMLVPRNKPPAAPAGVPWGVPQEPVFIVTCDLAGRQVPIEALAAEVRSVAKAGGAAGDSPDLLLLAHAGADDALALARLMGMQASYRPQHHQRVRRLGGHGGSAGTSDLVGVGLLSKHPLYEGGPLKIDRKRSAGVSAVVVVRGRKFRVACVYAGDPEGEGLSPLLEQRKAEGRPPTLLGLAGEAGAAARYREMLSGQFTEFRPQNDASGIFLLGTAHWRALRAGSTAGGLAWHVVGRAEPSIAPATNPTD